MFKARVGIFDDKTGTEYQPGDDVPVSLMEQSPWLLEQQCIYALLMNDATEQPNIEAPADDADADGADDLAEDQG